MSMKLLWVALAVVSVAGCAEAQDRVRRVASPKGEYHFRVYCRTPDRCLRDASDICPHGYVKEEVNPGELLFMCHGKADW